ncbi:MAG: hypothetical protein MJ245_02115 [Clostridia bacterium]|nr:hypothetical protein [Clostridia bacterium]
MERELNIWKQDIKALPKVDFAKEIELDYFTGSMGYLDSNGHAIDRDKDEIKIDFTDLYPDFLPDYQPKKGKARNISLILTRYKRTRDSRGKIRTVYEARFDNLKNDWSPDRYRKEAHYTEEEIKKFFILCDKHKKLILVYSNNGLKKMFKSSPASFTLVGEGNLFGIIDRMRLGVGMSIISSGANCDLHLVVDAGTLSISVADSIVTYDRKVNLQGKIEKVRLTGDEKQEAIDYLLNKVFLPKYLLI